MTPVSQAANYSVRAGTYDEPYRRAMTFCRLTPGCSDVDSLQKKILPNFPVDLDDGFMCQGSYLEHYIQIYLMCLIGNNYDTSV